MEIKFVPGILFDAHEIPALVEVKTVWPVIAANLLPSADEAIAYHAPINKPLCGSRFDVQVNPELVEV